MVPLHTATQCGATCGCHALGAGDKQRQATVADLPHNTACDRQLPGKAAQLKQHLPQVIAQHKHQPPSACNAFRPSHPAYTLYHGLQARKPVHITHNPQVLSTHTHNGMEVTNIHTKNSYGVQQAQMSPAPEHDMSYTASQIFENRQHAIIRNNGVAWKQHALCCASERHRPSTLGSLQSTCFLACVPRWH